MGSTHLKSTIDQSIYQLIYNLLIINIFINKLNRKTILAIDGFFIIACYNITIDYWLKIRSKNRTAKVGLKFLRVSAHFILDVITAIKQE